MPFLNANGIPHLFDPLLIPSSADEGIKEDTLDRIIVRNPSPLHLSNTDDRPTLCGWMGGDGVVGSTAREG